MSIAKDLYQLQEVDLALEANNQAQKRASSQIGESQIVLNARAKLAEEQKKLEELTRQQMGNRRPDNQNQSHRKKALRRQNL
jgi:hypothetical protein